MFNIKILQMEDEFLTNKFVYDSQEGYNEAAPM